MVEPIDFILKKSLSYRLASLKQRHPAITSEWPPIYFVMECITTSAPRAIGF